jgi:sulfane dehydrogenase subunit SoxC
MNKQKTIVPGRILPAPENHLTAEAVAAVRQSRRGFMRTAAGAAVAGVSGGALAQAAGKAEPPNIAPWTRALGPGVATNGYGMPSKYESAVQRRESPGLTRTPQSSVSFTPLQSLFGIITPSGLHFERHHSGMPEVDPAQHRLMINGMVRRPLILTMDDIMRFPSVSRIHFIECGATTGMEWGNIAVPTVQYSHGMLACSEFTGVLLSTLLD